MLVVSAVSKLAAELFWIWKAVVELVEFSKLVAPVLVTVATLTPLCWSCNRLPVLVVLTLRPTLVEAVWRMTPDPRSHMWRAAVCAM